MKNIINIVLIIFIVVFPIGCEKNLNKNKITIGAILPLTGVASQFGKNTKNGIELALENLQKNNFPYEIKLLFEDSQGNSKNAVTIFNKFNEVDKIDICFVLTSVETVSLIPLIEQNKILTITGTLLPNITNNCNYLFRNGISLDKEAEFMSKYLIEKKKSPTVSLIYINNDAGIAAKNCFENEYKKNGGEIREIQIYEPKTTDFRTYLQKIKNVNSDYIYILSYNEYGTIMKQAREIGIKSLFIGTSTFEDPSGVSMAGMASEGAEFTSPSFGTDESDSVFFDFEKKYNEKFNVKSEVYGAIFYDNINIIAKILTSLKDIHNQSDFSSALINIKDFKGASGLTTFLPNRDVNKPIVIKVIRNGNFEKIKE